MKHEKNKQFFCAKKIRATNFLRSKKGVTGAVLTIGVLVMAATFLLLGTARVLVPLIKTESQFISLDLAATMNVIYAAPEDVQIGVTYEKKGEIIAATVENNVACVLSLISGSGEVSKSDFEDHKENCKKSYFAGDSAAVTSEIFLVKKATLMKTYDGDTKQNTVRKK